MKQNTWFNISNRWQRLILAVAILIAVGCDSMSDPGTCSNVNNWLVTDVVVGAQVRTDLEIGPTDQPYLLTLKAEMQPPGDVAQTSPRGRLRLSLFSSAHALSCASPTTEDEILWITLSSNNDFDRDYLAGQELQDITLITSSYLDPDSYEPLTGPDARESWPLNRPEHSIQYYLLFDRLPTLDTEHTFNLQVMLASGGYFEITSPPISFTEATASP